MSNSTIAWAIGGALLALVTTASIILSFIGESVGLPNDVAALTRTVTIIAWLGLIIGLGVQCVNRRIDYWGKLVIHASSQDRETTDVARRGNVSQINKRG